MLNFSPRDKQRFRRVIDAAAQEDEQFDLESLNSNEGQSADLLVTKIHALSRIVRMAGDPAWSLPRIDKQRIAGTHHYIATPKQMSFIEWSILQAAAIELLEQDCHAELEMYNDFCDLRQGKKGQQFKVETRSDWLRYKREELQRVDRKRFLGMRRSKTRE